jgi:hypothetical protein
MAFGRDPHDEQPKPADLTADDEMTICILQIGHLSDGRREYPITFFNGDSGSPNEKTVEGWLKPPTDEIHGLVDALRRGEWTTSAVTVLGEGLYQHLVGNAAGQAWQDWANDQERDHVTLLKIEPAELRWLQWELMFNGHFVFARGRHGCVRLTSCDHRVGSRGGESPVEMWCRILVVVGEPPSDRLNIDEEIDKIWEQVAPFSPYCQVDVLDRPTPGELTDRLEEMRPHVLHFIGHWGITNNWIKQHFVRSPRLVVLSACAAAAGGATLSSDEAIADSFSASLADAFIEAGAAAVVAAHAEIDSDIAVSFTSHLYASLLEHGNVWRAVNFVRSRLAHNPDGSWAKPVLAARSAESAASVLPPRPTWVLRDGSPAWRHFADRTQKQRELCRLLSHPVDSGGAHGVLLTGETGTGKTSLLRSCLVTMNLKGYNYAHVEIDRDAVRTIGWRRLLHKISNQLNDSSDEQVRVAADRFTEQWPLSNAELSGAEEPSDRDTVEQIFKSFCGMLDVATSDRTLVIAIDPVFIDGYGIQLESLRTLGKHLLVPIASGHVGAARVVVVVDSALQDMSASVRNALEEFREAAAVPPIELRHFEVEPRWVFREFGARRGDWSDEVRTWWNNVGRELHPKSTLTPTTLWNFADLYDQLPGVGGGP